MKEQIKKAIYDRLGPLPIIIDDYKQIIEDEAYAIIEKEMMQEICRSDFYEELYK